jgi:hypothetical protein
MSVPSAKDRPSVAIHAERGMTTKTMPATTPVARVDTVRVRSTTPAAASPVNTALGKRSDVGE